VKGDKGDPGPPGESIPVDVASLPPFQIVFHDHDSWQATGLTAGAPQTVRLGGTIHIPPTVIEMWLEQTQGATPVKVGTIVERLGDPQKMLNRFE
jgi:hypothetical protein